MPQGDDRPQPAGVDLIDIDCTSSNSRLSKSRTLRLASAACLAATIMAGPSLAQDDGIFGGSDFGTGADSGIFGGNDLGTGGDVGFPSGILTGAEAPPTRRLPGELNRAVTVFDPVTQPLTGNLSGALGDYEAGSILNTPEGPSGMLVGDFLVRPTAGLSTSYDDNVFATNSAREEDVIIAPTVGVSAESLYERHSVGGELILGSPIYVRGTRKDRLNLGATAVGRLDFTPLSNLTGRVSYSRGSENAESLDTVDQTSDELVEVFSARTGFSQQFGGFALNAFALATREQFDDVTESPRDNWRYDGGIGVGRNIGQRFSTRASLDVSRVAFDNTAPDAVGGNYTEFGPNATVGIEVIGDIVATARFGYNFRFFDDGTTDFSPQNGLLADLVLDKDFELGGRTNLSLGIARANVSTNPNDSTGRVSNEVRATVTRQPNAKTLTSASLAYAFDNFLTDEREDQSFGASLGASYLLTAQTSLDARYRFSQRWSNDPGRSFYRNVVTVGLSAAF